MDRTQFRKKSRLLSRFARFQLTYSLFALFLAATTSLLGMMLLAAGSHATAAFVIGLGGFGFVAASLMLKARAELPKLTTGAVKWSRVALAMAIPGSMTRHSLDDLNYVER